MFELSVLTAVLLGSWLMTAGATRCAMKYNVQDLPNERSSHTHPTPRGGGVAIAFAFSAGLCILLFFAKEKLSEVSSARLLLVGLLVAFIGLWDDLKSVSAKSRIVVHLVSSSMFVGLLLAGPKLVLGTQEIQSQWLLLPALVVFLVWMINLFNFMDGIDGLGAGEAFVVSLGATFLEWLAGGSAGMILLWSLVSCAALGFLFHNWPPAKIFMGDTGSGFLGFVLAALALVSAQRGSLPLCSSLILFGAFFVDATYTLLNRFWRGERIFEAHRDHAYQHAVQKGWSHARVTSAVMLVNVFWLLPWAWAAQKYVDYGLLCVASAFLPLLVLAVKLRAGIRLEPSRNSALGGNP